MYSLSSSKEDLEFLIKKSYDFAPTNQMVIMFQDKLCQIAREDYYPDESGLVLFHKQLSWQDNAYSVAEIREFLEKYKDIIQEVRFEAYDGSIQELINITEKADASGIVFYTVIIVGDEEEPMTLPKDFTQSINNPNVKTIL